MKKNKPSSFKNFLLDSSSFHTNKKIKFSINFKIKEAVMKNNFAKLLFISSLLYLYYLTKKNYRRMFNKKESIEEDEFNKSYNENKFLVNIKRLYVNYLNNKSFEKMDKLMSFINNYINEHINKDLTDLNEFSISKYLPINIIIEIITIYNSLFSDLENDYKRINCFFINSYIVYFILSTFNNPSISRTNIIDELNDKSLFNKFLLTYVKNYIYFYDIYFYGKPISNNSQPKAKEFILLMGKFYKPTKELSFKVLLSCLQYFQLNNIALAYDLSRGIRNIFNDSDIVSIINSINATEMSNLISWILSYEGSFSISNRILLEYLGKSKNNNINLENVHSLLRNLLKTNYISNMIIQSNRKTDEEYELSLLLLCDLVDFINIYIRKEELEDKVKDECLRIDLIKNFNKSQIKEFMLDERIINILRGLDLIDNK